MAVRKINIGTMTPGTAPKALAGTYAAGETFIVGAPLQYDGSGNLVECTTAADVATGIIGFSATAVDTGLGADAANSPIIVTTDSTGREGPTVVQFYQATQNHFSGAFYAGTTPAVPAKTDLGVQYGLVQLADGTWVVNKSDTTNKAVVITQIFTDFNMNFVEFDVIPSVAKS